MKIEDFDQFIDRRHTGSVKWSQDDLIPMWVADMDFPVSDALRECIQRRASHPVFGYADENPDWAKAYADFWKETFGLDIEKENLHYSHGVVPIVSSAVRAFSKPGEEVLLMTPVYNVFYHSVENNGRKVSACSFVYENGEYSIDFADLERRMASPDCHFMVLCNPQNPLGRLFAKEELCEIARLAKEYSIIVLSDEIHCLISEPGQSYTPYLACCQEAEETGLCALSPTKAFNLAGIQTAAVYSKRDDLAEAIARQLNIDECNEPNAFSFPAAIAAFRDSRKYLVDLNQIISRNRRLTKEFFEKECPLFHMVPQNAPYLLWVDISKLSEDDGSFAKFLKEEAKVWVTEGSHYGKEGKGFLRINIACPLTTLREGLARIKKGYDAFLRESR